MQLWLKGNLETVTSSISNTGHLEITTPCCHGNRIHSCWLVLGNWGTDPKKNCLATNHMFSSVCFRGDLVKIYRWRCRFRKQYQSASSHSLHCEHSAEKREYRVGWWEKPDGSKWKCSYGTYVWERHLAYIYVTVYLENFLAGHFYTFTGNHLDPFQDIIYPLQKEQTPQKPNYIQLFSVAYLLDIHLQFLSCACI